MSHLILAYTLILVGLVLMASELVLYTSGMLSMLGLGGIIVGAVLVFGSDPTLGVITLVGLFVVVPVCGRILLNLWPNTPLGRKFVLQPPREQTTIGETPGSQELERLRGRYGKTLSPLRPAGTVDFDGRRIDAMSEGTLIDVGQWVRCVDVRASTVVVRETDAPPAMENLEEMKL